MIVPVADAVIVLIMSAVIIRQPVSMFIASLREVGGESATTKVVESVRANLSELLRAVPFEMMDVAVTKLGRTYFVVSYVKPAGQSSVEQFDELRDLIQKSVNELLGQAKSELVITARNPFG